MPSNKKNNNSMNKSNTLNRSPGKRTEVADLNGNISYHKTNDNANQGISMCYDQEDYNTFKEQILDGADIKQSIILTEKKIFERKPEEISNEKYKIVKKTVSYYFEKLQEEIAKELLELEEKATNYKRKVDQIHLSLFNYSSIQEAYTSINKISEPEERALRRLILRKLVLNKQLYSEETITMEHLTKRDIELILNNTYNFNAQKEKFKNIKDKIKKVERIEDVLREDSSSELVYKSFDLIDTPFDNIPARQLLNNPILNRSTERRKNRPKIDIGFEKISQGKYLLLYYVRGVIFEQELLIDLEIKRELKNFDVDEAKDYLLSELNSVPISNISDLEKQLMTIIIAHMLNVQLEVKNGVMQVDGSDVPFTFESIRFLLEEEEVVMEPSIEIYNQLIEQQKEFTEQNILKSDLVEEVLMDPVRRRKVADLVIKSVNQPISELNLHHTLVDPTSDEHDAKRIRTESSLIGEVSTIIKIKNIQRRINAMRQEYHDKVSDMKEEDFYIMPDLSPKYSQPNVKTIIESPVREIKNGILDLVEGDQTLLSRRFFEPANGCLVHTKMYQAARDYLTTKLDKLYHLQEYISSINEKLDHLPAQVAALLIEKTLKIPNVILNPSDMKMFVKVPNAHPQSYLEPITRKKNSNFDLRSMSLKKPMAIDPDHLKIIDGLVMDKNRRANVIRVLSLNRDYHELRLRSRVASAIIEVYKADKGGSVCHWLHDDVRVDFFIKGKVFETDSGVVYVSYFYNDQLYRSEMWRLPDIENYFVSHHRLVSLIVGISEKIKDLKKMFSISILYGRLLTENSWGSSKYLKPYRYFVHGVVSNSPRIDLSYDKFEKEISRDPKIRLSAYFLLSNLLSIRIGQTPAFKLPYESLGWEAFILNLCPSKTIGRIRHLSNVLEELYKEIDLYNNFFMDSQQLLLEFESLLALNPDNMFTQIKFNSYARKISEFSEKSDGRFTFTPFSIFLIVPEIDKISVKKIHYNLSISKLKTMRASLSSITGKACNANESISELSDYYGRTSLVGLIGSIILDKITHRSPIDLSMRMFDKDQVGGDREISILSSEMRIMQYLMETEFVFYNQNLDNEMLNKPNKFVLLTNRVSSALSQENRLLCTIDQTRWGPNFNTYLFALMSIAIKKKRDFTSLFCTLSQLKVFELPMKIISNRKSTTLYSIPGIIGKSHMGQGIFHVISSTFHSLCTKSFQSMVSSSAKCKYSSFITSDDCSMIFTFQDVYDKEMALRYLSNYEHYIKFYGIKTSTYKNIISERDVEFNCMFMGEGGIGSNEIKFAYSLIQPATTGNFLQDYSNSLNSYYASTNSGCDRNMAKIIAYLNYVKFCRQWKLNISRVGLPSEARLLTGLPPKIELDKENHFDTKSYLHYKKSKIKTAITPTEGLMNQFSQLAYISQDDKRERMAHNAVKTYYKGARYVNFRSPYYESKGILSESFSSIIRNMNDNADYHNVITQGTDTHFFQTSISKSKAKTALFTRCVIKQSTPFTVDIETRLRSVLAKAGIVNKIEDFVRASFTELDDPLHNQLRDLVAKNEFVFVYNCLRSIKEIEASYSPYNAYFIHNPNSIDMWYSTLTISHPLIHEINRRDILCTFPIQYPSNIEKIGTSSLFPFFKLFFTGNLYIQSRTLVGEETPNEFNLKNEVIRTELISVDLSISEEEFKQEMEYLNTESAYINVAVDSEQKEEHEHGLEETENQCNVDIDGDETNADEFNPILNEVFGSLFDTMENDDEIFERNEQRQLDQESMNMIGAGLFKAKKKIVVSCKISPKFLIANPYFKRKKLITSTIIYLQTIGLIHTPSNSSVADILLNQTEAYVYDRSTPNNMNRIVSALSSRHVTKRPELQEIIDNLKDPPESLIIKLAFSEPGDYSISNVCEGTEYPEDKFINLVQKL